MSIVLGNLAQMMTRFLSIDIANATTWNSYIKLSEDSLEQLSFWQRNLRDMNIRKFTNSNACSRIVYSDASCTGFAGYEVNTFNGVAHGIWSELEMSKSSTWRELSAVYRVLLSFIKGYIR